MDKSRLRTINRWAEKNSERHVSTIYIEHNDTNRNISARSVGTVDGLIHGMIGVLVDTAIAGDVSLEEITGKITGLMCERKRWRDAKNEREK